MRLLERDEELDRLERLVEGAREGRGRIALIEGPPGIGKTRLVEATRARAADEGMTVLSARASELDRDFPLGVVRQLFEPLLMGAAEERRATLLAGAAAPVEALVGVTPSAYSAPAAEIAHLHALYWLVANLVDEAPTLLAIDDLHWADTASLRFLQFLAPRLEELPLLLVLATRPRETGIDRHAIDALATDPLCVVLHPAALSDDGVARLLDRELGGAPEAGFAAACRNATGGNPFLLRELARELASDRVAPDARALPLVRELAPPTVARAVLLRLARLGDDAASLARAVAVLGDAAPLRRAAALAGLDEGRADEAATALADAHILGPERPLGFVHPILRSAVHADMDAAARARAHRATATLLAEEGAAADAIAVHLLAAEPAADAWVVATLRAAAGLARERGAASVAVACLRRAAEEPPPPAERSVVLLELGSAELHAGEPATAVEHFGEGVRVSTDPRPVAVYARDWAIALQSISRHEEAFAVRERAAEEVAPVDAELALDLEVSLVASAGLDLARIGWARERLERDRGETAEATPAGHRLRALGAYHQALYGSGSADALADVAERAIEGGKLIDPASGIPPTAFFTAAEVLWLADRIEPVERAFDQVLADARVRASVIAYACTSGWRAMLLGRLGRLAEAEADARTCAELSLGPGWAWFAFAQPMLGYVMSVLIDRGELDDAERLLSDSGFASYTPGTDLAFFPMVHARARLRAARGHAEGAEADFEALRARRARWNTETTLVPPVLAAPSLGVAELPPGMIEDARAWGTPRAIGMALRAEGLVSGSVDRLREAAAMLERSPARLEHARALADLGAALRRANRRAEAREPLRQALDLADACGAPSLASDVRHELRAAGGRPRRPRLSGASALTASERRVAAIAADGLSNPEIAQALFVSKKTVEAHLGNSYRKLGISSRAQLARALSDA